MTPGQLGPPPGDMLGVTRPFLTDAVVFDTYVLQEGMVIPQGTIRTRYHPETCPALPQQLARVSRGDTAAALAFVRTYGLGSCWIPGSWIRRWRTTQLVSFPLP